MADKKQDDLDGALDAALAKYAAVEPRPGLEARVLAHLCAERARVPDRVWWRWSVAGALAAVVIVILALALKTSKPHPAAANHSSPTTKSAQTPKTQLASGEPDRIRGNPVRPQKLIAVQRTSVHRSQPKVVSSENRKLDQPKLDQFPSPQPLSEQEKLLQSYVAEYPERAVLIARARSEALQRDLEEMQALAFGRRPTDSDKPTHATTER
jgi:hypothetical protein